MSLKLNERYPGRFNNPSNDYPQGSFKNRTTPTSKDGSYLEKDWANDKEGFFQSLLSKAGVLANGLIDKVGASQYFDALIQTRQAQTGLAFTSAGVSPALTLTPSPALTAYSANQRFRVKFAAASTGSDTLNISGLGAKNIKQYSATGAKVAAVFAVNQLADVEYDGTDFVMLDPLPSVAVQATETISGIAKLATQSQTDAGTDDATIVTPKKLFAAQKAALNLKMNLTGDGATPRLGAVSVNSGLGPLYPNQPGAYLFWNEYGDCKASWINNQGLGTGGFIFRNVNKDNNVETGRVVIERSGSLSTTGSINSAAEIYGAGGAVTVATDGNINGRIWGGWLSSYLAKLQPLGVGQTWQNVTGSRSKGVTYTNTTGRPIYVSVMYQDDGTFSGASFSIGSLSTTTLDVQDLQHIWFSAVIPDGVNYSISGGVILPVWWELR